MSKPANPAKGGYTKYGKNQTTAIRGKAFDIFDTEGEGSPFETKKKSKFVPKGIDPAYPNRNFVKMHYDNKGDPQGFFDHMYGPSRVINQKTPHGFGHANKHRVGKDRNSGNPRAHRIGKR